VAKVPIRLSSSSPECHVQRPTAIQRPLRVRQALEHGRAGAAGRCGWSLADGLVIKGSSARGARRATELKLSRHPDTLVGRSVPISEAGETRPPIVTRRRDPLLDGTGASPSPPPPAASAADHAIITGDL